MFYLIKLPAAKLNRLHNAAARLLPPLSQDSFNIYFYYFCFYNFYNFCFSFYYIIFLINIKYSQACSSFFGIPIFSDLEDALRSLHSLSAGHPEPEQSSLSPSGPLLMAPAVSRWPLSVRLFNFFSPPH